MTKKLIPFMIMGFIVAFAAGLYFYKKSQNGIKEIELDKKNIGKQQTQIKAKGSLKLISERQVVDANDDIIITVYADSAGQVVGGYDTVINFDSEKATFVEAKNISDDLQMFVNQRDNGVGITQVKGLDSSEDIIHVNNPIAELIFKPKAEGKMSFTIAFSPGNTDDSNIVTLSAQDILSSVEGADIFIGKGFILKLNTPVTIPGSSLKVKLANLDIPDSTCSDCVTQIDIEVANGKDTQTLTFTSGGIDGMTFQKAAAFNYAYDIELEEDNLVKLFVSKAN